MLSASENETLTRVGRGTPMGELLRRYWQPVAAVAQLDEHPTLPVCLMGEDLVLYKDTRGRYGLLDRHCPHRRADLCYGVPEERGLRCHYHGWLFDDSGACLQQPFEEIARPEARFRDKIRTAAYPVQAKAGLLWTSDRCRRRWCLIGISSGSAATSRSCSPRSPATGSRGRRTRSIRFTSSGCTATGPPRCGASPARGRRGT
jgi:nitrite reductase/ring-hydroxylating ferredoxin subunit